MLVCRSLQPHDHRASPQLITRSLSTLIDEKYVKYYVRFHNICKTPEIATGVVGIKIKIFTGVVETQIPQYKLKLAQNLNLNLYHKLPSNLSLGFPIWCISKILHFQ